MVVVNEMPKNNKCITIIHLKFLDISFTSVLTIIKDLTDRTVICDRVTMSPSMQQYRNKHVVVCSAPRKQLLTKAVYDQVHSNISLQ